MLNKSSVSWWTFDQPEMLSCKDSGKLEYDNRTETKETHSSISVLMPVLLFY